MSDRAFGRWRWPGDVPFKILACGQMRMKRPLVVGDHASNDRRVDARRLPLLELLDQSCGNLLVFAEDD